MKGRAERLPGSHLSQELVPNGPRWNDMIGGFDASAIPDAFGPRNDGQFCALAVIDERIRIEIAMVRHFIFLDNLHKLDQGFQQHIINCNL